MIALVGQSVLDRTTWPDATVEERLGGAPVFAAQAIADVCPALIITRGGDVELRRPLHSLGLQLEEGPSEHTMVCDVTLHGDGTWSEAITALGDGFSPLDVEGWMARLLERCSTVVCGAQWRDDFPAETLAALARGGHRVYLDGQGPARPSRLGPVRVEGPLDPGVARLVAVLKLAEEEAVALIGGIDPVAALALGVPVVVVTLGERGAVVLSAGEVTEVAVDAVLGLTDTVGAGDSFLALMAAAAEGGANPIEATATACDGVARLLRARRDAERSVARAPASVLQR